MFKRYMVILAVVVSATLINTQPSYAKDDVDAIGVVWAAAQNNDLSERKTKAFVMTAKHESDFKPWARGDYWGGRYHSFGLFQLCDCGELWKFYHWGYTDPFDAEQNADFAARLFKMYSHTKLCNTWSAYRVLYCGG